MKTRKLTLAIAALLLTSAAFVSSCKKKTTNDKDTDTAAASDNSLAESTSNDVIKMTGQASENGALSSYKMIDNSSILSNCATITIDTTLKKFTITFNPTCVCKDGHYRSGSLLFDYSGSATNSYWYRNPGFKCVITTPSNDYYVDGNKVTLSKTIINTTPAGFNPATTNMTWSVNGNVTILKSSASGGGTINWNCNRTVTLMNTSAITYDGNAVAASYVNQTTPIDWLHAVFSVSGSANGTSAAGLSYSFTTTSPLVVNMNCAPVATRPGHHPIVQGGFDFTPGTKSARHVDFGTGTCDNTFVVTIDGVSYTITIN